MDMDVVALGELLMDFTAHGISQQGNCVYEANPGGAPCNVLSMLQRLGRSTAFIGKVGNDSFGKTLKQAVEEQGICAKGLRFDESVPTTLAFVHTTAAGERAFSFYRNLGADMMLRKDEVDENLIRSCKIFHFGSLSMTSESADEATRYALKIANKSHVLVSFDPNLRSSLWNDLKEAKRKIGYGFSQCDVLKISDNEIAFMTGEEDVEKGVQKIIDQYGIPLVCATMGKRGSKAFYKGRVVTGAPFSSSKTIDATGAGDTFCGCVLYFLLRYGMDGLTSVLLKEMLEYANAAACLVTTRKGALRAMPTAAEIEAFVNQ